MQIIDACISHLYEDYEWFVKVNYKKVVKQNYSNSFKQ